MAREPSREEISRACRTLRVDEPFGKELDAWRRRLHHAFQRLAYQTHPDRAAALGQPAAKLAAEFQAVNAAFQLLRRHSPSAAATRPAPAAPPPAPKQAPRPAGPTPAAPRESDHFHRGPCPSRRLRLGELLYYKGHVSWRTLVGALAWQRRQRPLFGDLAVEWGFLTPQKLHQLLDQQCRTGAGLPLGELAYKQGALSAFQLMALVGRQQQLQRPLGEYFVERGLVAAEVLARLVQEQRAAPAPSGA